MSKDEQFVPIKMTVQNGPWSSMAMCGKCGLWAEASGSGDEPMRDPLEGHLCQSLEGPMPVACQTYWGSHGCRLPKGHNGPCICDCDDPRDYDPITRLDAEGVHHVGACPYYGADTNFYGDDATPEHVSKLKKFISAALAPTG